MYQIAFSPQAQADLAWFKNQEQNIILAGIEQNLCYEPTVITRNRKPLRPNTTATWELRIGKYRVFYDTTEVILIVSITAIGSKIRDKLQFRRKKRTLCISCVYPQMKPVSIPCYSKPTTTIW
jgi:mRNA-degrading endonuclease RelE of RelBE toxin-antitoxin system